MNEVRCTRCHRPLRRPSVDGMGPVCAKRNPPAPTYERDLLGFDIDLAVAAARERLADFIESKAAAAHIVTKHEFRQARIRMGVWAK